MTGLLALLDDVAAIAKVAAASVDDVVAQAVKASSKAAGAVIDDAAVTPKFLSGFSASRELPIVWRIARGSIFNKLVILLPIALLLQAFAPSVIPILLMIGGAYLCFEGAEKVAHWWQHRGHGDAELVAQKAVDPHLEETRVKGAIKTDFILSAEIMTIVLAALPQASFWFTAASLAIAAILITVLVYGAVAVIVKADDVGLSMAASGKLALTRSVGKGIVRVMPSVLTGLTIIGTAAMLWVGGAIVVHGLHGIGIDTIYAPVKAAATAAQNAVSPDGGFVSWAVQALLDGIFGLLLGLVLIPIATKAIVPAARAMGLAKTPEKTGA